MAIQDLTPQLRTRLQRVEKIVGAFVLLAILALLVGFGFYLHHLAEQKGWFIQKCPYFTFVQSAEGLKVGAPVMLMGFDVGNITSIIAEPPAQHRVFVGMEVRSPYYGYIWSDSKVRIGAAGLLGGRQIEIVPGVVGEPTVYEVGGRISELRYHSGRRKPISEVKKGVLLEPDEEPSLSDQAQALVGTIKEALPNILCLTNELYTILTNTAQLTANANEVATNMVVVTGNLRNPNGSLGEWVLTPEMQTNLNANLVNLNNTILNLAAITSNLNTQVQTNSTVLTRVNTLVSDTDNLVQGLKKHWLLRGVFLKMNSQTNAPPANIQSAPKN